MKKIIFVTGNERKLAEAKLGCQLCGIEVEQVKLDIDEIQSDDPAAISEAKAKDAFEKLEKPLVVTDTSWGIPALNGFPGAYAKYVAKWFGENDFLHLMSGKADRRVSFTESITYIDEKQIKKFSKQYWGMIVETPRGTGNSIENVCEFDGVTLGERRQMGGYSNKPEDYIWHEFAKWYSNL